LIADAWGTAPSTRDASPADTSPLQDVADATDPFDSDSAQDSSPTDTADTTDDADEADSPDAWEDPNPWGLTGPALAAGRDHVCVIVRADDLAPGDVWCWGGNDYWQLGLTEQGVRANGEPKRVVWFDAGTRSGAVALTAGDGFTCALRPDGSLWCWGDNRLGQLGDGTQLPQPGALAQVKTLGTAWGVSAGDAHACALLGSGEVKCWGDNRMGQLGDGGVEGSPSPQQVLGFERGAAQVIADGQMTCALTPTGGGQAWCWGADPRLRDRPASPTPTLWATDVARASLGEDTLCVWDEVSITPRCVGRHPQAIEGLMVGGAFQEPLSSPVEISRLDGARTLALEARTRCFLDRFGWPWCWGQNEEGQLGPERAPEPSLEPGPVSLPGRAQSLVITGSGALCARDAQGQVWCWGNNADGVLGRRSVVPFDASPAPANVPQL
jgi:hypothetical protein